MNSPASGQRGERAADAYEINTVLARYCRGVDRVDSDLLRGCFHDTAQEVRDGVALSRDEFVDALIERSPKRYESVMHFLGNVWIDFTGDHSARTEAYVTATSVGVDPADPRFNRTVGVRYIDDFERRSGVWRISGRVVVFDWVRRDTAELPAEQPRGRRDHADPSYLPISAKSDRKDAR